MYSVTITSDRFSGSRTVDGDVGTSARMLDPRISLEVNRGGSFTFSVYDDHPLYSDFYLFKDRIHVFNNGVRIFSGRGIQETYDFYNKRTILCEGALAFLSDVIVPYSTAYESVEEYLKYLIDYYNTSKNRPEELIINRFSIESMPSVWNRKDVKELTSDGDKYKTVFDLIQEVLEYEEWNVEVDLSEADSDTYGLIFRQKSAKKATHPVTVKFAENLIDLTRDNDMADFATVFYPLGRPKNTSNEEENDHKGVDYIAGKTFVERQYINSNGSITTEQADGNLCNVVYSTESLPQSSGSTIERVMITARQRSGRGLYSFLDSSGNPLTFRCADTGPWDTDFVNQVVEVPEGAATLFVAFYGQSASSSLDWGAWRYSDGLVGPSIIDSELIDNYIYIDSYGRVIQEEGTTNNKVVTTRASVTPAMFEAGKKLIISTKQRNGHGLYMFKDNFDHVLDIRTADNSPVITLLQDEVVTIPEGAKSFTLGFYGAEIDAHVYAYKDDGTSETQSHLGDDLMITQAATIRTVFGHIDETDGHIVNYETTPVVGAKADSVVYTGLKVTAGKKYIYSGMNRDSHGMIRVRGEGGQGSYYLKTASSGSVPTNLQLFEFEVPAGDTIDLGGLIGDAKTHLWEYVEDKENKDNYITIESENLGVPYLIDEELVAEYGWIEKVQTFDDIDSPKMLVEEAKKFFKKIKMRVDFTYTVKTIDPSIISDSCSYLPLDSVTVVSSPHGVNVKMDVKRAEIHLDAPQNNTYEFVYEK